MKKLTIIISILLCISSCKKEAECPFFCESNIENDIVLDIHYNKISCTLNDFNRLYFSEFEYKNDGSCNRQPIPIELGFEGIVIAQGVYVPYISENENIKKAYDLSVEIKKDSCLKTIDFKFTLANVDTFERFEHNENVLVLLNGVDSTYTVNFSHEIIPYEE